MKSNSIVPQSDFFVTLADGHAATAEQITVIELVNRVLIEKVYRVRTMTCR